MLSSGLSMSERTNVSLHDDAYAALAAEKRDDESFTDVVLRLCSETDHTHTTRIDAEQAEEIARMAGRFAGDEVEDRLSRR